MFKRSDAVAWNFSKSNLKWYEYVWAALPIALMTVGGMAGGACGGAAFGLNVALMRSKRPAWFRFGSTGCISLASAGVYLLIVRILLSTTGMGDQMTTRNLDQELAKNPTFVLIRRVDPENYAAMRQVALGAIKQGKSPAEIQAVARMRVAAVELRFIPFASDAAVIEFTRIITLEVDQIGAKSAEACVQFLFPKKGRPALSLTDYLSADVISREIAAATAVIETGSGTPRAVPQQAAIAGSLVIVVRQLTEAFGSGDVAALSKPDTLAPQRLCAVTGSLYKDILLLPEPDAAALLRWLFSKASAPA
jgi:hypothetical protein